MLGTAGPGFDASRPQRGPYTELQRGEAAHAGDNLSHDLPDLRPASLPACYEQLLAHELPLAADEIARLRRFTAQCWSGS